MHESQIRELDRDVAALKVGVTHLADASRDLAAQIRELEQNVDQLNRALERGRGAIWALTTVATMVGAIIGMAVNAVLKATGKD